MWSQSRGCGNCFNGLHGSFFQANEETGNRRPVMISIRERAKVKKAENVENATAENKHKAGSTKEEPTNLLQHHGVRAAAIQGMLNDGLDTGAPICDHADAQPVVTSIPMLDGLNSKERTSLLTACVGLIGVPVDRDALNAVLRLCLRLTQDFEQVSNFFTCGEADSSSRGRFIFLNLLLL